MNNTDTVIETATFNVPESRIEWLKAEMAKLTKRANKIGCAAPTMTIGDSKMVEVLANDVNGIVTYVKYFSVVVSGQAPRIAGWTFVATLDHADGEVMLRTHPSFEGQLPTRFRCADPRNCDHCRVARQRNETFVLRNDATGDFQQIGRQCLRDFLGHENPMAVASVAELLWDICETAAASEDEPGGVRGGNYVDIGEYLSFVAAAIRNDGWLSRKAANQF